MSEPTASATMTPSGLCDGPAEQQWPKDVAFQLLHGDHGDERHSDEVDGGADGVGGKR